MTHHPASHASNDKIHEALALLTEAAKDKKSELQALLSSEFEDLRTLMAEAEHKVLEREQELEHEGRERLSQVASTLDKKVHEDPWLALGWVTVGALLFGYILARKD